MKLPDWLSHKNHIPHDDMVCPTCGAKAIKYLYGYGHICTACGFAARTSKELREVLKASKLALLKSGASLDEAKLILASVGVSGLKIEAADA